MSSTSVIANEFDLSKYFEKMELIIQNILLRPEKNSLTYDECIKLFYYTWIFIY